jgi:hypothetical protein
LANRGVGLWPARESTEPFYFELSPEMADALAQTGVYRIEMDVLHNALQLLLVAHAMII